VEKCFRVGQTTDEKYGACALHAVYQGYKHTLTIYRVIEKDGRDLKPL